MVSINPDVLCHELAHSPPVPTLKGSDSKILQISCFLLPLWVPLRLCQGDCLLEVVLYTWFAFINWLSDILGSSMHWLNVDPPPPPPHSCIQALTPNVWCKEVGPLGGDLVVRVEPSWVGRAAHIKEAPESFLPFSAMCRLSVKITISEPGN